MKYLFLFLVLIVAAFAAPQNPYKQKYSPGKPPVKLLDQSPFLAPPPLPRGAKQIFNGRSSPAGW